MIKNLFTRKKSLQKRCQTYLEKGPPEHMDDYVPESITEIIIAHGAQNKDLDPELKEIAQIILNESDDLRTIEDKKIREYLLTGSTLVFEVLKMN